MGKIKSVLFVCTGNSCRSTMAEGLLKKALKDLGRRDIEVRSCGISAIDGLPPTQEAIDVMHKEGIDISGYRSKRISGLYIKKADLILAMSAAHKNEVLRISEDAGSKTYLLKELGCKDRPEDPYDFEVPDPIGRSEEFYGIVFNMIKDEINRIMELL